MSLRRTKYISRLENAPKSSLFEGFVACATNPDIINLGTAENRIMDDHLLPILQNRPTLHCHDVTYPGGFDDGNLRASLSLLYRDHFGIKDALPDQFTFGSGIAFLVEKLGLVLCDENDTVLIPKPCYGCFEPDLAQCGAKVEYIDLDNLPERPPETARLIILTNPGNPIGEKIKDPEKLLEWCYKNPNLHIVSDDVYALSNRRGEKYQSIAGLPNAKPEVVHQYYGMSKDWALAGCHVGFFWTRNEELHKLMSIANGCFVLSSDTVRLCQMLIGDVKFRDNWIKVFQERLTENEKIMENILKKNNITFRQCDNSLFLMIDLREIVKTPQQELDVWRKLMYDYKVHILPGMAGFHYDEPGWYRVIFSIPKDELVEGLDRLSKGISEIKNGK